MCKTVINMKNKSGTIPADSADLGSVTLGWGMQVPGEQSPLKREFSNSDTFSHWMLFGCCSQETVRNGIYHMPQAADANMPVLPIYSISCSA